MGAIKAKVDQMGVAIYNNIRIKEMQEQLPTVELVLCQELNQIKMRNFSQ